MSEGPDGNANAIEEPERKGSSVRSRRVRLVVAVLLLVSCSLAAIVFYEECVTTRTGGGVPTSTCHPPEVTSPVVLAILLLVALLLWPDLSEVAVLGVSLKRRVDAAELGAKRAQEDVASLHTTIQLQEMRIEGLAEANSSASANITMTNSWDSEPDWSKGWSGQLQKIANMLSEQRASMGMDVPDASESVGTADLKLELLEKYEEFATAMGYNIDRRKIRSSQDPGVKRWVYAQQEFFESNREAVQSVRALRNGIAHAQLVDRQAVIEGLEILSELQPKLVDHYAGRDVVPPFDAK